LIGFAGRKCREIVIDGRKTVFADGDVDEIAWAPVAPERRVRGGAVLQVRVSGTATLRIPIAGVPSNLALFVEGPKPGSRGKPVISRIENGVIVFEANDHLKGKWIYGVAQ
jgi:hypothetical protein